MLWLNCVLISVFASRLRQKLANFDHISTIVQEIFKGHQWIFLSPIEEGVDSLHICSKKTGGSWATLFYWSWKEISKRNISLRKVIISKTLKSHFERWLSKSNIIILIVSLLREKWSLLWHSGLECSPHKGKVGCSNRSCHRPKS